MCMCSYLQCSLFLKSTNERMHSTNCRLSFGQVTGEIDPEVVECSIKMINFDIACICGQKVY